MAQMMRRERQLPLGPSPDVMGSLWNIHHNMTEMFSDLFRDISTTPMWNPPVNLFREGDNLVMEAALPGIKKDQVNITCTKDTVTIKGEATQEKESKEQDFYHKELVHGMFTRTISLPGEIECPKIKAKLNNGILRVEMPLAEASRKSTINVKID